MSAPGPMTCAKHPKVETYLRCPTCDKPICPKCAVQTAVGYKCRDCGTYRVTSLCRPTPMQALAAIGVGLVGGSLAGALLSHFGFFGIWIAVIYGRFLGTLCLKASGRKLGLLMDIFIGSSIAIGGLCGLAARGIYMYSLPSSSSIVTGLSSTAQVVNVLLSILDGLDIFSIVIIGVVIAAAISRLRYNWNYWGF